MRGCRSLVAGALLFGLTLSAQSRPAHPDGRVGTFRAAGATQPVRGRAARPDPVGAWLRYKGVQIQSLEPGYPSHDLLRLSPWLAGSDIVSVGDGTHGTREFYQVKQRLIGYLSGADRFRTVAFEGPWNEFLRINDYIQGGDGDPSTLLRMNGYFFWEYEEMRELVEWARAFNAVRPADERIEFLGLDVYGSTVSRDEVLAYLAIVDPAAREIAQGEYGGCVGDLLEGSGCPASIDLVRQNLEAKRTEYVAATSLQRFLRVLQSARVIEQSRDVSKGDLYQEKRDLMMAENAKWIQTTWLDGRRLMIWAHNEHVGRLPFFAGAHHPAVKSMGAHLNEAYGSRQFVVGTCMLNGSMIAFIGVPTTVEMQPPTADNYELLFARAGYSMLAAPLFEPDVPAWLKGPGRLRFGISSYSPSEESNPRLSLPEKFDAIIYIESTSPARPLP